MSEYVGVASSGPSAAFFDLDRTLMAGSSGLHFVRAAYAHGMISRRRLAGDSWGALKFRLWGSTDAGTEKVRARIGSYIQGVQERELRRLAPQVLAGVLPRLYPQMLAVAYEHQDPMRVFFNVKGPLIWLGDKGESLGVFDVHDYIAMSRAHYEKVGLGAAAIDKLFR